MQPPISAQDEILALYVTNARYLNGYYINTNTCFGLILFSVILITVIYVYPCKIEWQYLILWHARRDILSHKAVSAIQYHIMDSVSCLYVNM